MERKFPIMLVVVPSIPPPHNTALHVNRVNDTQESCKKLLDHIKEKNIKILGGVFSGENKYAKMVKDNINDNWGTCFFPINQRDEVEKAISYIRPINGQMHSEKECVMIITDKDTIVSITQDISDTIPTAYGLFIPKM
jgi:hypothetical protein